VAKKAKRSEVQPLPPDSTQLTATQEASSSDVKVLKNKEGDSYVDIGKKKHVTVREFKGMQLVDIREFYTDKASGEDKPGKKGISLTLEQVCFISKGILDLRSLRRSGMPSKLLLAP